MHGHDRRCVAADPLKLKKGQKTYGSQQFLKSARSALACGFNIFDQVHGKRDLADFRTEWSEEKLTHCTRVLFLNI